MQALSEIVRYSLAVIFAVSGIAHILFPRVLRRLFFEADYAVASLRAVGIVSGLSAVFLLTPHTHIWGIALAATSLFLGVVALLYRRLYLLALVGILAMTLLPIAIVVAPVS